MSLVGSTFHPRYVPTAVILLLTKARPTQQSQRAGGGGGGIVRQGEYGIMKHRPKCTLLSRETLVVSRAESYLMELFSRRKT